MKRVWFVWSIFIFLVLVSNGWALSGEGDNIGSFKGVVAKSNGGNTATTEYQCVEYVKRFYKEAFGLNLYKAIGVAKNYYTMYDSQNYKYLKQSGLVRHANGGNSLPEVGDIIVFDHTNDIGHVAIVSSISSGNVNVIEQNWNRDYAYRSIPYSYQGGVYSVSTESGYPVLGWLHLPGGKFSSGWVFDVDIVNGTSSIYNGQSKPFATSYQNNNSGDILGFPFNDVHVFPGGNNPYGSYPYSGMKKAWVQDFQKNGQYFTFVMNEYTLNMGTGYMGVAFPVLGQIRLYWLANYWNIGYPVTNEYYFEGNYSSDPPRYTVQWFERLENEYYVVIYDNWTQQIWHESEQITGVPKEHFAQDQETNSVYDESGVGSGGTGYDYISSENCEVVINGPVNDPYNRLCINPSAVFNEGDTVFSLSKIGDVFVDHQWKVEVYRNGSYFSSDMGSVVYPDHTWGWQYSIFETSIPNVLSGNYVLSILLNTGSGFEIVDTKVFAVPDTKPDYIYQGAVVCEDVADGPPGDVYDLQPVNPRSTYMAGDRVYLLAKLKDVYVDHRWKFAVYKDNILQWDYPTSWSTVDPVWGWEHSVYAPYQDNVSVGNYEFWLYLDVGNGFSLLEKSPFEVLANNANMPYLEDYSIDPHGYVLEDHNSGTNPSSLYASNTEGLSGGRGLILNNSGVTDNWKVQVRRVGFNFQQGTNYQGQIYLKSDTPGTVYIAVQRDVDPWDNMGMWETVNVTTSWQAVDIDFTAIGNPQLDPDNVRLTIMAGELAGKLYIDDVSFQ